MALDEDVGAPRLALNTAKFFIVSKCVQLLGKKLRLYEMGNASRSGK